MYPINQNKNPKANTDLHPVPYRYFWTQKPPFVSFWVQIREAFGTPHTNFQPILIGEMGLSCVLPSKQVTQTAEIEFIGPKISNLKYLTQFCSELEIFVTTYSSGNGHWLPSDVRNSWLHCKSAAGLFIYDRPDGMQSVKKRSPLASLHLWSLHTVSHGKCIKRRSALNHPPPPPSPHHPPTQIGLITPFFVVRC